MYSLGVGAEILFLICDLSVFGIILERRAKILIFPSKWIIIYIVPLVLHSTLQRTGHRSAPYSKELTRLPESRQAESKFLFLVIASDKLLPLRQANQSCQSN